MKLTTGWVDTSIGDLLGQLSHLLDPFGAVLVTSVDSTTDLRHIPVVSGIVRRHPECRFVDGALLAPGALLTRAVHLPSLFTGFDELWCFDVCPGPGVGVRRRLAGPPSQGTDDEPAGLADWMRASGCRLGLGDGFGMSYATFDEEIARMLERSV
ncbi:MAG: hypothetical protein JWM27_3736 [Gemmatimonadetes bacterium]|nr:hypothetical protein [Gemmatimonadota bacterium]